MARIVERAATPILHYAVMHRLAEREILECFISQGRVHRLVLGSVALVLHNHDGAVRAAQVPDVFQPVGQRVVAEGDPTVFVLPRILALGCPDQEEKRARAQEKRMSSMIEVLAAEVPEMQRHLPGRAIRPGFLLAAGAALLRVDVEDGELRRGHANAVRGIGVRFEFLAPKATTDLRLANPPIPQHQHFHVRQRFCSPFEVAQVRPNAFQAACVRVRRQDLRGNVGDASVMEIKLAFKESSRTRASGRSLTCV